MKAQQIEQLRDEARARDMKAAWSADGLRALDADHFHRVVKVCCEEGCVTSELADQFALRAGSGDIEPRDALYPLLLADGSDQEEPEQLAKMRKAALAWLILH